MQIDQGVWQKLGREQQLWIGTTCEQRRATPVTAYLVPERTANDDLQPWFTDRKVVSVEMIPVNGPRASGRWSVVEIRTEPR